MHIFQTLKTTGADGILYVAIPLGKPETAFEVAVVVQPKRASADAVGTDERGWPIGYFESTFGSIDDETFARSPQGELPSSQNPWLAMAGMFDPANPIVQEWKEAMAEYRRQVENDPNYL